VKVAATLVLAAALASMPAVSHAQEMQSFDDIGRAVQVGDRLAIKDVGGATTRGKVVAVSSSSITLTEDGARREFDRTIIADVRRSDRLWNGLLIGVAGGFVASEVWVYGVCGPRGYDSECSAIASLVGWVTFVPGGAALGALVDKGIGNQLIYRRSAGRTSLHVVPILSPSRRGGAVSLRF
jgi:hypothetical protein